MRLVAFAVDLSIMNYHRLPVILIILIFISGCKSGLTENEIIELDCVPFIEPDYSNVTIPWNIAPMNFLIREKGSSFIVNAASSNGKNFTVRSSSGGVIDFPVRKWHELLSGSEGGKIDIEVLAVNGKQSLKYKSFSFHVALEPADPYICYRLLYPGYETNVQLKIIQRNIKNFGESVILENLMLDTHCLNCHNFHLRDPNKFMVKIRGNAVGTYFVDNKEIKRIDLKLGDLTHKPGVVYPSWHPDGRFTTFSSNHLTQIFHAIPGKRIEGIDLASFLLLYDTERNEMLPIDNSEDSVRYMDTYPEWSPDGKYLYFCRAPEIKEGFDFENIKYDLARKSFDPSTRSFGKAEIIFDAKSINKSVSFPKISPDSKYLVFTLHDYGNFSAWHKEADLYLIDLKNGMIDSMDLNSPDTESYHSWSSNGKWLIFSSKRGDGLAARTYFAYVDSAGEWGKPFVLPQKDPALYNTQLFTYNLPEFVTGKIHVDTRDFRRASRKKASAATWIGNRIIAVK